MKGSKNMKLIKKLLIVLMMVLIVLPINVKADEKNYNLQNKR